ncbi:MAG: AAA family ATPase [Desulfosporosinus sp.]|nr:AAA family ATPase [Desulfosporosinus sp.]
MIIKSIALNNFRQYKGAQPPILFSTDKEKNVTVILGVNTSGKTTLIQAFEWCLYERVNFKTRDVLNIEVAKSMDLFSAQEVFVEIVLIHEDREFTIRRTQKSTKSDADKFKTEKSVLKIQFKEDNGEQQAVPAYECDNTINKILPEALSDYFFFDGERIADINNRGDVVAAVRGLMGLDVVGEAKDRLDPNKASSVTAKFSKELDVGSDQKNNKLKNDLTDAQTRLDAHNTRRKDAKDDIEYYERRKEELSAQILANKDEKHNQDKKLSLEKDIAQITKNIENDETRIVKDFSAGTMKFFATPLIYRAMKVIDEAKDNGEGIPEMRSAAIDFILDRQKCICGCDLIKNEGARENILYEQRLLPPQHLGTVLRTSKETFKRYLNETQSFCETVKDNHTDYRNNRNFLDAKTDELKNVSAKIQGNIDVAKIEQDYQKNEKTLKDKRDLLLKITSDIGATEKEIAEIEKTIERLTIVSDKNERLRKCIAYAKAVYEWLKVGYDKQEKEVKERLLESVNNIFEKMYHGKRHVTINDRYQIVLMTLLNNDEVKTDESKGLEAVKNFSFISGLVDLARQKAHKGNGVTDDEEIPVNTEAYPLVMDAPFSNADEIHINNISKIIPEIAEQVILMVMQKDWEFARPALEDKIGCRYSIEKINNSDTNSVIRRNA